MLQCYDTGSQDIKKDVLTKDWDKVVLCLSTLMSLDSCDRKALGSKILAHRCSSPELHWPCSK